MGGAAISQEQPTLNGFAPSWTDISTTIDVVDGATLTDIDYAGFKYSSVLEFGEQRKGGRVVKRTTGSLKDTASGTFYKSGLRTLLAELTKTAPVRGNQKLVGYVAFSIGIKHSWPGDSDIYEVRLRGCRLGKIDESLTEGNEAEKAELDLNPMQIVWLVNGEEVCLL